MSDLNPRMGQCPLKQSIDSGVSNHGNFSDGSRGALRAVSSGDLGAGQAGACQESIQLCARFRGTVY